MGKDNFKRGLRIHAQKEGLRETMAIMKSDKTDAGRAGSPSPGQSTMIPTYKRQIDLPF